MFELISSVDGHIYAVGPGMWYDLDRSQDDKELKNIRARPLCANNGFVTAMSDYGIDLLHRAYLARG